MPALATDIPRGRKPWTVTFFGLLAVAGLAAMPFLAGQPDADKMPDLVRFIGHFHPVVLHLPIGVFALILFQELGWIFGSERGEVRHPSLVPLFFGAASAVVATLAGFMLYQGGAEYAGNDLVERHMWAGLAFAIASIVTYMIKAWTVSLAANPAYYRLFLFASVGVMGFASHDGGSITHGDDFLTKFAPDPIRKVLGLEKKEKEKHAAPADPAQQVVYTDIVAPIFESHCVQCHKESKSKGKFRIDTYELLVKGGKEGTGLEPGNSAKSRIVERMELPLDDEEHMPPENKKQLEADQLAIVKWWIDQGADPKKTLADLEVSEEIAGVLARISPAAVGAKLAREAPETPGGTASPDAGVAAGPDPALAASVETISKEFPGAIGFESRESSNVTFTAVSLRGTMNDADFAKIAPLATNLVTVDLSATKITDKAVAELANAKNLRLIRLAETDITDAAIDTLVKLPELESINLYGTKITDAGIAKLAALPNLRRLYLWQTSVTPAAIKTLQEKLPNCEIVTGIES